MHGATKKIIIECYRAKNSIVVARIKISSRYKKCAAVNCERIRISLQCMPNRWRQAEE